MRARAFSMLAGGTAAMSAAAILIATAIPYPFIEREPAVPQQEATLPSRDSIAPHEPARGDAAMNAAASDDITGTVEAAAENAPPPKPDLSYLVYYAYSEVPPEKKPAETILESMKDIPLGTPLEEIKRACAALGLDFNFMATVAKIESDFDPKQRTGSYIGLFQLSNYEFQKYGSGDITNPRDNAVAAVVKFSTAAVLFELETHKKPTPTDLYLIHQQGTQGAAEHVSHPERIAWQSMCATDEGRKKGERWCKRAVWQNTLPAIKQVWKSVDNLTSGAFVAMWHDRVAQFYARFSAMTAAAAAPRAAAAPTTTPAPQATKHEATAMP